MSEKKFSVGLAGIGGFGKAHLDVIEALCAEGIFELRAVCETNSRTHGDLLSRLKSNGVSVHGALKEMLSPRSAPDLLVVSTPIHFHMEMSLQALRAGIHVFLEKPPAVTVQDVDGIITAAQKAGKTCAVDFRMLAGSSFRRLMGLVAGGTLGEIRSVVGVGMWKRLDSYYERSPWAGKLVIGDRYVLDGVLNNPLSHLLNNMLALARYPVSEPAYVTAELYHAHAIEGDDTACVRVEMSDGAMLHFYATLCHTENAEPFIVVEGSRGSAKWTYGGELRTSIDGKTETVTASGEDTLTLMYRNLCAVLKREEADLICPVESTRSFVLCSNGAFESSAGIHAIPASFVTRIPEDDSIATRVHELERIIVSASNDRLLFSEAGLPWAIKGRRLSLSGYREFRMFR